jgi:hypothetical protein
MKVKLVIVAGIVITVSDFLLALYWLAAGLVIFVHHSELLLAHVVAVTHYAGAVMVLMAIEGYWERMRKIRTSGKRHPPSVVYLASWSLLTLTTAGSDAFILMDIIAKPADAHDVAWACELAVAIWATANTVLCIMWSAWMANTALRERICAKWFETSEHNTRMK